MPADDAPPTLLTPAVIRQALDRLADVLVDAAVPVRIVVFGGASLALAYFPNDRTVTADVDGTYHPVDLVEDAARQVAEEMGLVEGWLNNRMRMFLPPDGVDDSVEIIERDNVSIRVGSARALLALKLRASRPNRDFEDIAILVRACGISTVAACEQLIEDYYLGEEEIPRRGYLLLERAFDEVQVTTADPPFVLPAVDRSGHPGS